VAKATAVQGEVTGSPLESLIATGPALGLAGLDLYGRLVGEWDIEVVNHRAEGDEMISGEWLFGWALEGRAIADVWRTPPRREGPAVGLGVTVRVYDPVEDEWKVTWNAANGTVHVFAVRHTSDEIVQERRSDGEIGRWIFSEITRQSFEWRSVASTDEGQTWELQQEMHAKRRA
jgi:hypothetical protein